MDNQWFAINDIIEFTDKTRFIVYNNFGKWGLDDSVDTLMDPIEEGNQSDIDQVLSHAEALTIVQQIAQQQADEITKEIKYCLNEQLFIQIIEELNARMVSNVLSDLLNKGIVESAYDTEANDFVFWIKNNDKNS